MISFPFYLAIIAVLIILIVLANKLRIAYPILLVLAGLIISFIPGVPLLKINPEIIFFIFLPPIIFDATWSVSWKELWKWRRIISSFALIVVFLSAGCVAFAATLWLPGFTLALGFVLGGIVSPPDAVSAGAIMQFVKVPKRISSMLEGESLLNDASSLIILQFALLAVTTGEFHWNRALASFLWMVIGGISSGLLIGWLFVKLEKVLPTNANIDIIISLLVPYLIYFIGDEIKSSGILAVVSGGLYLSRNRQDFLTGTSRMKSVNFIGGVVFILNGVVFLLIGLAVPQAVGDLEKEGISLLQAIGYGLIITLVLFVTRMIAAYGAAFVTVIARNFINVAEPHPGYKVPLVIGWAGMRGIVSLAAALSIPVAHNSEGIPKRNFILFVTFVVILSSLLIQGLTLPVLIKWIKLPDFNDYPPENEGKKLLRAELHAQSIKYINKKYGGSKHFKQLVQKINSKNKSDHYVGDPEENEITDKNIYLDVLEHQRRWLHQKNINDKDTDEDLIRLQVQLLDLEEERIRML